MLDSCIYFRDALDSYVSKDVDMRVHRLSEKDWEKAIELHLFLKTLYEVTVDFFASQTPTTNIYFYGVWKLHMALNDASLGDNALLSAMAKQMLLKFEKYWADYNLLLSCAAGLDPRLKLTAIEYCYTRLFGETCAKETVEKLKTTLLDLMDEYKEVGTPGATRGGKKSASSSSRSKTVSKAGEDLMDFLTRKVHRTDKSELKTYLDENNKDAREELDVLMFWKKGAHKSHVLSALARDILSIPNSSVPSECAFSLGKKMITPCRSSLRASTIEALACYEDWLRVKRFDGTTSTFEALEETECENDISTVME